ncbi:hypothetical protein MCOR27_005443 [Pyricularia oryzae]|uniref:Uncharacterized protein n=3 Tax=Pyricularia oryzae TaxID=318829 RepID=G4N760_PYRO7|nr:uncharacterized protein MGG_14849 [Pyricularia oryzae 70-15]ELQ41913.1 hypothetical protein OOU_Y34scaffold00247g47 [Pyricularia oryzae Y34]KAH8843500.1 hypothetical protein MCOR01_004298 [Pyricularia oryzae]EHA50770.1 hypothetical protein MGG_14849 [Pyricularia oryzae 70-15]KAH9430975.1 hypothetical protein MCOR02_008290 [Pyricularia oryzae]KAI6256479.1 hypothetical protein MCOR19_007050 [Pyricularia oryzae]
MQSLGRNFASAGLARMLPTCCRPRMLIFLALIFFGPSFVWSLSRDIIVGHVLYLFQFGGMSTSSRRNLWSKPLFLPTLQFHITSAQHLRAHLDSPRSRPK